MLVTLSGIVTFVNPVQLAKALEPILVTLSGIVMLVRPVQLEKAFAPILVTLLGIVMLVRPAQLEKAEPAIPTVPSFKTIDVFSGIVPL